MKLTDSMLIALGEEGLIPGPDETEERFRMRASLLKEGEGGPPLSKLKEIFSFSPSWIHVEYSNRKLTPWQGAATWITESPEGVLIPRIQLREKLRSGRIFLTSRDEVLHHEALHAIRLAYPESRFEELFTYHTSASPFRSFLGPLFRRPYQAWVFLALLLASLFLPLFPPLPLLYLSYLGLHLARDRRLLRRALREIKALFPAGVSPMAVAFRLIDKEIEAFARGEGEPLLRPSSLRWRALHLTLFPK